MEVFVWVGYGSADVYDASTENSLLLVYKEIKSVFQSWGGIHDDIIAKADRAIADAAMRERLDSGVMKRIIRDLVDEQIGESETFEYGTGFCKVK